MTSKPKLTVGQLAPYLPYKLKCRTVRHQIMYGKTHDLLINGLSLDDDDELNIEFLYDNDLMFSNRMNKVFPILRPLPDLVNEIEHEGEKFIPLDELQHLDGWCDAYQEWWDLQQPDYETMMLNAPYEIIVQLLEWHFDVFGLIPKGLAVSY